MRGVLTVRAVVMAGVLALAASGCSSGHATSAGSSGGSGGKYTIIYGGALASSDPNSVAQNTFADLVAKKSDGQIKVKVYQSGQLGTPAQMIQAVNTGSEQMTYTIPANLSSIYPAASVANLPFLFDNDDQAAKAYAGAPGQKLTDAIAANTKMRVLAWGDLGFVQILADKEISTPADMRGVKIRVVPNDVISSTYTALGATPVVLNANEVYTGLQQGVVSADGNDPISVIDTSKFYETAKHLTLANIFYNPNAILINNAFYEKLPANLQKAVSEAAVEAEEKEIADHKTQEQQYLSQLKASGVTVTTLTDAERAQWKDKVQSVYSNFASKYGTDVLDALRGSVQ